MGDIPWAMPVGVGEFSSSVMGGCDQMRRIVLAQDRQGLIISALFDVAVSSQVPA